LIGIEILRQDKLFPSFSAFILHIFYLRIKKEKKSPLRAILFSQTTVRFYWHQNVHNVMLTSDLKKNVRKSTPKKEDYPVKLNPPGRHAAVYYV
jgi:hypothetical protein